jgi:hypothetical protein
MTIFYKNRRKYICIGFNTYYLQHKPIFMTTGTRIPRDVNGFNSYISITGSYLTEGSPTNASRLGITDAEVTTWKGFGTSWNPLFTKYGDKKNSRTTAVIEQLHDIIDNCVAFDQSNHILDRIAASTSATITDFETFNVKSGSLEKNTRSISTTPISEKVSATIQPLGGGSVSIKSYTPTSQRAGICDGADSVQYTYSVGTTPPASADADGLKTGLSTKASFTLDLGAASSAKYLYIYFRWYNTKHPDLAGPWCSLETMLIL